MKYVILIHSNPQPWGHPTSDFLAEHQSMSREERDRSNQDFEKTLTAMQESGELLGGEALGDPRQTRLFRRPQGEVVATDGPYSESKEHFAGFFQIDVASQERAEEIAAKFSGPGETVELRPVWS